MISRFSGEAISSQSLAAAKKLPAGEFIGAALSPSSKGNQITLSIGLN